MNCLNSFYPAIFLLLFSGSALNGQVDRQLIALSDTLYQSWPIYKEDRIGHKFFRARDITSILEGYSDYEHISIDTLGYSVEGRPIHLIRIGHGAIPVAMWTQMHGNEPTATMAIVDMLRFFTIEDNHLTTWKSKVYENISLYIIPMLNPDGAEIFKRRNALDIDLNRDALRLESPESQLLKGVIDSLQPHFGFNLHDQSDYYTAGMNDIPATISFLAPAYDEEKSLNDTRANAMRLIVQLNDILQQKIPGAVGRFNDTFEPRAFGDNIQKWGTSTILIESGSVKGDLHKQTQRQLHFTILLSALESIAEKKYLFEGLRPYEAIPFNNRRGHDIIIRHLSVPNSSDTILIDIAFHKEETRIDNPPFYNHDFYISDIGDLSTMFAFEDIDASELTYTPGLLLKENWRDLLKLSVGQIIEKGYSHVLVKRLPPLHLIQDIPLQFLLHERDFDNSVHMGSNPGFFLHSNDESQKLFVNKGQLYNLPSDLDRLSSLLIDDLYD